MAWNPWDTVKDVADTVGDAAVAGAKGVATGVNWIADDSNQPGALRWLNNTLLSFGGATAGAKTGAAIGATGGPIGAIVGGGIGLVAGYWTAEEVDKLAAKRHVEAELSKSSLSDSDKAQVRSVLNANPNPKNFEEAQEELVNIISTYVDVYDKIIVAQSSSEEGTAAADAQFDEELKLTANRFVEFIEDNNDKFHIDLSSESIVKLLKLEPDGIATAIGAAMVDVIKPLFVDPAAAYQDAHRIGSDDDNVLFKRRFELVEIPKLTDYGFADPLVSSTGQQLAMYKMTPDFQEKVIVAGEKLGLEPTASYAEIFNKLGEERELSRDALLSGVDRDKGIIISTASSAGEEVARTIPLMELLQIDRMLANVDGFTDSELLAGFDTGELTLEDGSFAFLDDIRNWSTDIRQLDPTAKADKEMYSEVLEFFDNAGSEALVYQLALVAGVNPRNPDGASMEDIAKLHSTYTAIQGFLNTADGVKGERAKTAGLGWLGAFLASNYAREKTWGSLGEALKDKEHKAEIEEYVDRVLTGVINGNVPSNEEEAVADAFSKIGSIAAVSGNADIGVIGYDNHRPNLWVSDSFADAGAGFTSGNSDGGFQPPHSLDAENSLRNTYRSLFYRDPTREELAAFSKHVYTTYKSPGLGSWLDSEFGDSTAVLDSSPPSLGALTQDTARQTEDYQRLYAKNRTGLSDTLYQQDAVAKATPWTGASTAARTELTQLGMESGDPGHIDLIAMLNERFSHLRGNKQARIDYRTQE